MTADRNLQFIRDKIYQLRSAIMYSMSNGLVKIPNNIVTAIRVDDEGHLWFLAKRPSQLLSECEQTFPARLHFYRKGVSFYLEISGKASIVSNEGPDTTDTTYEKPVLIKMTMVNIEYVEAPERKKNRFEIWLEQGYKWLARHVAFPRQSKPVLAKLHQPSI
ncbi:MAG TPA: hypothetical protein VEB63_07905 [Chitinophagaceae bacterium]|nr:hypothetical protein [Chitinophagaceae bacterium]